jgi:hypothetical protein
MIDDQTHELVMHMESDIIEFLEFEKKDRKGNPYINKKDGKPYVRLKLATKGFDYKRDCGIIRMNSAILTNLFYTKGVSIKTAADASRTIGYYLLDNFTD